MLYDLFYSQPLAYAFLWLLIDFVIAGSFACMALSAARFFLNKYLFYFIPLLIFIVLQTILGNILTQAAPHTIMQAIQMRPLQAGYSISGMFIYFIISLVGFWFAGGRKHEAL